MNSFIDKTRDVHIVMLDYDVRDQRIVVESIEELQAFWRLSDAYVFSTKNGHHVFFFYDHVPYGRLQQIIAFARDVDPMYKYIGQFYDHKTIRVFGKHKEQDIAFVGIVPGNRVPTKEEWVLGEMKRKEHLQLVDPLFAHIVEQTRVLKAEKQKAKTKTKMKSKKNVERGRT